MSIIQVGSGYDGGTISAGDTVEGSGTVTPVVNDGSLIINSTDTVQVSGTDFSRPRCWLQHRHEWIGLGFRPAGRQRQ